MDVIGKHMWVMKLEKKREITEIYAKLIFPRQEQEWTNVKWTTQWGVTFVTRWDEEHLLKNIKFAMLQEMMGLGPMKYCIVYSKVPNFSSRLLLLINCLPQQKMCFYPPHFFLDAPFNHSPWREIGEAIHSQWLKPKEPCLLCSLLYLAVYRISKNRGVWKKLFHLEGKCGTKPTLGKSNKRHLLVFFYPIIKS